MNRPRTLSCGRSGWQQRMESARAGSGARQHCELTDLADLVISEVGGVSGRERTSLAFAARDPEIDVLVAVPQPAPIVRGQTCFCAQASASGSAFTSAMRQG
jgi:hypothetical protein